MILIIHQATKIKAIPIKADVKACCPCSTFFASPEPAFKIIVNPPKIIKTKSIIPEITKIVGKIAETKDPSDP